MNNVIKRVWNKNTMVNIEDLQGMAFQAESGGHTFQISGIDGEGNAVALSGTPAGVMLRADGQDVTLTCSVSGGVVSATLPANAYSVPGRFGLTIFLTSDGQKTAIYAAVGTVGKTSSGTVAPPAGSDVVTLVNQINTAIAAIPANYNACFAPAYSTSGLYSVGQYVTYNGNLYRCNTAITTAETWTAAHWTQTNLGADVYDLKSALNDIQESTSNIFYLTNSHYSNNGITVDLQQDGTYLFNGTATANMNLGVMGQGNGSSPAAVFPAGSYSFGWQKVSGSVTLGNQNDFSIRAEGTASANTIVRDGKASSVKEFTSDAICTLYIKSGSVLTNYKVKLWVVSGTTLGDFVPNKVVVDYTARAKAEKNATDIETNTLAINAHTTAIESLENEVSADNNEQELTVERTDNIFFLTSPHYVKNGVTIDIKPDGSYEINGTATASILAGAMGSGNGLSQDNVLPVGDYYFAWEKISGSVIYTAPTDFGIRANGLEASDTKIREEKTRTAVTVENSATNCTLYIKKGTVLTNYRVMIWIVKGNLFKDYNPYVTAKDAIARKNSLKNQSDIQNLTGAVSEAINELQGTTDNILYLNYEKYIKNGITAELQPDGTYLFNGTAISTTKFGMMGSQNYSDNILEPGTYSFGWEKVSGSCTLTNDTDFSIHAGGDSVDNAIVHDQKSSGTITVNSASLCLFHVASGSILSNYKVKLWCRKGDKTGAFIPHKTAVDYTARERIENTFGETGKALNSLTYPILLASKSVRGQGGTLIKNNVFTFIRNASGEQSSADMHYFIPFTGFAWGRSSALCGLTAENSGHANDMCYNPNDDCIYVVTSLESGAIAKMTNSLDAVYDSSIYPEDGNGNIVRSSTIAYNRLTEEYLLHFSGTYEINVFNSNWEYVKTIEIEPWTYNLSSTQGMDTDGTYIYLTKEGKNGDKYTTVILTYEMDGTLVEEYNLRCFSDSDEQIETEGLAYDWSSGAFMMNCNIHSLGNYERLYAIMPNSKNYHCVGIMSLMIKRWMNGAAF